ncbi:MAG TPA: endonuclease NucS [Alphaproteobacteria bacterium]|nr:endonuclease NucS [Alphaproteobacteria bacterium]
MNDLIYDQAVEKVRGELVKLETVPVLKEIAEFRDDVLARFQPIFSEGHLSELTEQEFRAFLLFENNHHWPLHRSGSKTCADMSILRSSLTYLLSEEQPVDDRFNRAVNRVPGMGKAIVTAILQVAYPEKYGVWNNTSEGGLKALNLWPRFERGESMGGRYIKINQIFSRLADDLQIDLWSLDALWWNFQIHPPNEEPKSENVGEREVTSSRIIEAQGFGLERHLHEFLRDNWSKTSLGREWNLYSEPGDEVAGFEYPCGVGRIDLLARHKDKARWLVVELKRDQASDSTVGQILRYIGWVKAHLAEPGEEINGLVIARQADDALRYALSTLPNIDLQLYAVDFRLLPVLDLEV